MRDYVPATERLRFVVAADDLPGLGTVTDRYETELEARDALARYTTAGAAKVAMYSATLLPEAKR